MEALLPMHRPWLFFDNQDDPPRPTKRRRVETTPCITPLEEDSVEEPITVFLLFQHRIVPATLTTRTLNQLKSLAFHKFPEIRFVCWISWLIGVRKTLSSRNSGVDFVLRRGSRCVVVSDDEGVQQLMEQVGGALCPLLTPNTGHSGTALQVASHGVYCSIVLGMYCC